MHRTLFMALLLSAGLAPAQIVDELSDGLGAAPCAELHYKFEVTFMKIDVADVTVLLAPGAAGRIASMVAAGRDSRQTRRKIGQALLATDTLAVSFRLRRDGGFDRFMQGMRQSLQYAQESEIVTMAELESVWHDFEADMTPLFARGGRKGDALFYRIEGPRVRLAYISAEGEPLFDVWHEGDAWARGVKGSYLGPKSRFGKPLIRSLLRTERRLEDIP